MLKILLNGNALILPDDIQINLVYENPLFLVDRIPAAHTLSFNLPAVHSNLAQLGHPERLASNMKFLEYENCQIYFGPRLILSGVLVVKKFNKDIQVFVRESAYPDNVKLPMYEMELDRYDFGTGDRFAPDFDTDPDFAYNYRELIESSVSGSEEFVAAPVRILDTDGPFLEDQNEIPASSGYYASSIQYLNFWNANAGDYILPTASTKHCVIFPFPFLHYVVDQMFGDTLKSNPFSTGELAKLVLCNFFHPQYNSELFTEYHGILLDSDDTVDDVENYFELSSFSPSMKSNEMFKQVLKMICATLFIRGGKFEILFNQNIIDDDEQVNWTNKLIGDLEINQVPGKNYRYGYAQYNDHYPTINLEQVADIDELHDQTVAQDEEKDFYVTGSNQVITMKMRTKAMPTDPDRFDYLVKSSGYAGNEAADNTYQVVSDIAPLNMSIHDYWWENAKAPTLDFEQWYVSEWKGDRLVRHDRPAIMLFHGLQSTLYDNIPPEQYPFISGHNINPFGAKIGDLSLQWEGDDGLLETYHKPFLAWVEKDKVGIRNSFLLTADDLRSLDLTKKHYVRCKNFYIERLEVTIHFDHISPASVTMVEA